MALNRLRVRIEGVAPLLQHSTQMMELDSEIGRAMKELSAIRKKTDENHREMAAGLQDVYMSAVSNRMNEVMKVLTVIATIFIPLTFIAGIYGMNFDPDVSRLNMPELKWAWGYPVAMAAMVLMAVIMVICFWRKGWLGKPKPRDRDQAPS